MPINNLLKCKNTTSRMFRNTTIFQFNCFKATIYKRLHIENCLTLQCPLIVMLKISW